MLCVWLILGCCGVLNSSRGCLMDLLFCCLVGCFTDCIGVVNSVGIVIL